jgi:dTDP-glucose 4,6-dehydratase
LHSDYNLPVNIGNQDEITLNQCVKKYWLVGNPNVKIDYHPLPEDDPKTRRPDISLAKKLLN